MGQVSSWTWTPRSPASPAQVGAKGLQCYPLAVEVRWVLGGRDIWAKGTRVGRPTSLLMRKMRFA